MKKRSLIHYVELLEKEGETVKITDTRSIKPLPSVPTDNSLLSAKASGLYFDTDGINPPPPVPTDNSLLSAKASGPYLDTDGINPPPPVPTDNSLLSAKASGPYFDTDGINPPPSVPTDNSLLSEEVSGLFSDSRKCLAGGIFFCKGRNFLTGYLTEALKKGVLAVIYEKGLPTQASVFSEKDTCSELFRNRVFIEVKNVRKAMALLAAFHYGYPMRKAVTVAVTGTKGKTSTVTGIRDVLNEKPGLKAIILNDALPSASPRLTTPEPIELHAAAAKCIEHNATHIICEISSQGVKELRTYGIVFDLACFLNFGADHVSPSEHPTLDDYFNSKARLFSFCKRAVINLDSERSEEILRVAEKSKNVSINPLSGKKEIFTFSEKDTRACFFATVSEKNGFGSRINVLENVYQNEKIQNTEMPPDERNLSPVYVNSPGGFNVQNALAVFSVCRVLGCTADEIFRGILLSKTEGRMEIFDTADGKVRIVVDYAHNKMSFTALFEAAKRTYSASPPKITAIFGCSGEKAYGRRYDLPEVALRHSDRIIICEDDSGREGFERIKNEILANISEILKNSGEGYVKNASISVIQSRERAVNEAVKSAFENGERRLILFAGRGRESTMYLKDGETPIISDVSAAMRAIKVYNSRLSLDSVLSGLTEKRGQMITVSFENHEGIISDLSFSAAKFLQAGVIPLAVCDKESAETLKEQCYKNGIASFLVSETKTAKIKADAYGSELTPPNLEASESCQNGLSMREIAFASAKRGALTVAVVSGDVKARAAEISVREKTDALVYLTHGGGIILNGKPFRSVISESTAALISKKFSSPYLTLACNAVSGGTKAVAVIDGSKESLLTFFGAGAERSGTVIKKEKTKL